jgi:N-acetylglucosamine-6-phosphate deacetylase
MKCIVNGTVYTSAEVIPGGVVTIEGGTVHAVRAADAVALPTGVERIDADGGSVVPGFIDLHFYGCGGHALSKMRPIAEELAAISKMLPRWGTTSYLISLEIGDPPTLMRTLEATADAIAAQQGGAQPLGIHLEGPFLDPRKPGAFPLELLREPDVDEVDSYLRAAKGYIRLVTLAPNLPGSRTVARHLTASGALASLGHTAAPYEEAASALKGDFSLVTHIFNAMSGLHHRRPGTVGAALTSDKAMVMLICDGIHVHPAVVQMLFRTLGPDRLILVTDAMSGTGLGDGVYQLFGQRVTIKDGKATLSDGTIAGSVLTMDRAMANVQDFTGCALADALRMVCFNPATVLGLARNKGRIAPGCDADIVVLDGEGRPLVTLVRGEIVWQR